MLEAFGVTAEASGVALAELFKTGGEHVTFRDAVQWAYQDVWVEPVTGPPESPLECPKPSMDASAQIGSAEKRSLWIDGSVTDVEDRPAIHAQPAALALSGEVSQGSR